MSQSTCSPRVDPYLVVVSPGGEQSDNDDWEGNRQQSRIEFTVTETGTWSVYATTYAPEQEGQYALALEATGTDSHLNQDTVSSASQTWTGTLEMGDEILNSGEFADFFDVHGESGERWILDLQSTEFDPSWACNCLLEIDGKRRLRRRPKPLSLDFVLSEGNHCIQVTYQAKEMLFVGSISPDLKTRSPKESRTTSPTGSPKTGCFLEVGRE